MSDLSDPQTISEIISLLNTIQGKHGSAASFTINNFREPVIYATYIAKDTPPAHQDHPDIHAALRRLYTFASIDNLAAYNKRIAREIVERLQDEKEIIGEQIEAYKRYL